MRKFEGFTKGINLGGWLSQCRNQYNENHYSTFITETDIAKIASWGLDHVRLPIDYNVIQAENGEFIESGFAHIDDCIAWSKKYNLNVVLDIHKTKGFIFDDPTYCAFFSDEALQDNFVTLWREMTRRYGNNSEHIAFELMNEVTFESVAQTWNKIAARTIAAIRETDKNTKIIIGGIYNSSIFGLNLLEKPADENIVFTFHCYSPIIFTHQSASWVENMPLDYKLHYPDTTGKFRTESHRVLGGDFDRDYIAPDDEPISENFFRNLFAPALKVAEKFNVPLYCGEYGVIDFADCEDTVKWYEDINRTLNEYGISRAAWTYKSMDFGITDEHLTPVYDQLTKLL